MLASQWRTCTNSGKISVSLAASGKEDFLTKKWSSIWGQSRQFSSCRICVNRLLIQEQMDMIKLIRYKRVYGKRKDYHFPKRAFASSLREVDVSNHYSIGEMERRQDEDTPSTPSNQHNKNKIVSTPRASSRSEKPIRMKQNVAIKTITIPQRQNPWALVARGALEQETRRLQNHGDSPNNSINRVSTPISLSSETSRFLDYFDVMQAWAHHAESEGMEAATIAESLLYTMEGLFPESVSLECYKTVLQAYAKCSRMGGVEAAEAAEALWHHLRQSKKDLLPTAETFELVVTAWANSKSREAAERIAALQQSESSLISPSIRTHETIRKEMKSWSISGHPQAPERILQLLLDTVEHWQKDQQRIQNNTGSQKAFALAPTIDMFHTAMAALSKSATQHNQRTICQVADQIHSLMTLVLERQGDWNIQPTLRTFMIVLGALERKEKVERTGKAAKQAEALLDKLIQDASKKEQPRIVISTPTMKSATFNISLRDIEPSEPNTALSHQSTSRIETRPIQPSTTESQVLPATIAFTSVMVAWCHADRPDRAEFSYHRLVDLYRMGHSDKRLLPTTVTANVVLAGWARQERLDRVIDFLHVMTRIAKETKDPACFLTLKTFNVVLNALAKSGSVADCLSLLLWLEEKERNVNLKKSGNTSIPYGGFFHPQVTENLMKPDVVSYCCVLEALGKQGMIVQAEDLLDRMKQRNLQPTKFTYTMLINAYVGQNDPQKVVKAAKIYQEMAESQVPDVIASVSLMQVCSHALVAEKSLALDLAFQVYECLDSSQRNHRTYKVMATCIKNLVKWETMQIVHGATQRRWSSPEEAKAEQNRLLQLLARDCCEGGFLSYHVYKELGVSLRDWSGTRKLQPDWSRNVMPRDRPAA